MFCIPESALPRAQHPYKLAEVPGLWVVRRQPSQELCGRLLEGLPGAPCLWSSHLQERARRFTAEVIYGNDSAAFCTWNESIWFQKGSLASKCSGEMKRCTKAFPARAAESTLPALSVTLPITPMSDELPLLPSFLYSTIFPKIDQFVAFSGI